MDAEPGKQVWKLPKADSNPVKMIRPFELLRVVRDSSNRKQTLATAQLPRREIDKIVAEVRSGGVAIDAGLPSLTTAELISAVPKSHPTSSPTWSVQPDVLAKNPRMKMERTVLIASSGAEVQRMQLAGNSGKAVLLRKSAGKLWLETYDLLRGKRANQSQLPAIYDMVDTNLDGSQVLVGVKSARMVKSNIFEGGGGFDRLDVVSTGKKHICAWRPFAGEKESGDQVVQWARFVDNNHVATMNSRGKLILWQIPECKAEYIFADFGLPLALSGARKYVLSGQNDSLRIYDLLSGECAGELQAPPNGVKAIRAAFRHDGNELAAVIDNGPDKTLARWSMGDGSLSHNFPLHPGVFSDSTFSVVRGMAYRGDEHLLVDNRFLINLERRAVIWRYNLKYGVHLATSYDGRQWYCAPYESTAGAWHINALTIPGAGITGASEFNSLEEQLALYPGMRVGVQVQLSSALQTLTADQIRKGISDRLVALGYAIDQQNPQISLTLTTTRGSTGEQLSQGSSSPFGRFGFGGRPTGGSTFNQEKVTCKLTLTDPARKVVWERSQVVTMRGVGTVRSGNAQGDLRAEMLRSVEGLLANGNIVDVAMPRYVFHDLVMALSGESDLTLKGEGPRISPAERQKEDEAARKRASQRSSTRPGPSGGFGPGSSFSGRGGLPGGGFLGRGGIPGRGGFP